jgi:hypothetical protein
MPGLIAAVGLLVAQSVWAGQVISTLTAVKVKVPPALDGRDNDDAWKQAKALEVPVAGGTIGNMTVTLKTVYTAQEIYLLAKWPDKTMTVEHEPWIFSGSTWEYREGEGPFEDRFAIQWNISVANFPQVGCMILCHAGGASPDKKPRMHTNAPGEFTDEWHWKAVRSNPMGYVDDKYVDSTVDPKDDEAGHHADGGTRVYTRNQPKDGTPSFVWKSATLTVPPAVTAELAKFFLLDGDKAPYGPINPRTGKAWAQGDKVPHSVLQTPTESNADIKAHGAWKDGVWTLEMSRALDTKENAVKGDKKIDVIFDPAKTYHFGISVFDNAEAMGHSFSGPLTLKFKN